MPINLKEIMKTKNNILYKTLVILLLSASVGYAQQPNLKEKIITKTFDNIDNTSLIGIENKFGDINMETSADQKNVEVEIIIQSWHTNENKAISMLEQIKISDHSNDNNIQLETIVPSNNNNNSKKGFKIVYHIKAPTDINVDYTNKYGSINTESIAGSATIHVSYGSLKTKDLNGQSNEIKISYGSGDIDFIEKGEVTTRYLSKLNIGQANNLEIDDKYGNIYIGTAGFVRGEAAYSNLEINTLRTALDFESDYGSIKIQEVEKSFEQINADSAYGSIKIGFGDNTPFNFEAKTRYGSFKHNIEGVEVMKSIEHNTSSEYSGYRFDKNSTKKIYVKSAYGSIKFN